MSRSVPVALAVALAAPIAAPQHTVHVVDFSLGPGSHFGQIQPAIDVAGEGDLILVRPGGGSYTGFEVRGKSVTIQGTGGVHIDGGIFDHIGQLVLGPAVVIEDLAPNQQVVLRGLSILCINPDEPGLHLEDNDGEVLIEDSFVSALSEDGIVCQKSSSVTFVRTAVTSLFHLLDPYASPPPPRGLDAVGSGIFAYESTFLGSTGESSTVPIPGFPIPPDPPVNGGDGARLENCSLYASNSSFLGGAGGANLISACFPAAHGGAGLRLTGGPSTPLARLLACTLAGGAGGAQENPIPSCGPAGIDGPNQVVQGGASVEFLHGLPRAFLWTSPTTAGASLSATYSGAAGDLVFLAYSGALSRGTYLQPKIGVLHLDFAFGLITSFRGTVAGNGTFGESIPAPMPPPGVDFLAIPAQALFVDGSGGFHLSGPSVAAFLAPGI